MVYYYGNLSVIIRYIILYNVHVLRFGHLLLQDIQKIVHLKTKRNLI